MIIKIEAMCQAPIDMPLESANPYKAYDRQIKIEKVILEVFVSPNEDWLTRIREVIATLKTLPNTQIIPSDL